MKKMLRIMLLSVTVMMAAAGMAVNAYASGSPVEVRSAAELENALIQEQADICLASDMSIDRTFYVTADTRIYSEKAVTLTRAGNFGGDIFVVGENKDGEKSVYKGDPPTLQLGSEDSAENDQVTINGNRGNMSAQVNGTVFFIGNGSVVNLYDNLTVTGCEKTGNDRTNAAAYQLPHTDEIGGSVAIVAEGNLNIFGGKYQDNCVNDEVDPADADNEAESEAEAKRSSTGGAFYNYSNLNIYGGIIANNRAGRGGAIYNYRKVNIDSAVIEDNSASKYGGALYQAQSQFAEVTMGDGEDADGQVVFARNQADSSGGAIFSQTKNAVVIYGNTTFSENQATNNGGAFHTSGALTIKQAAFTGNKAGSKGGAVYIVNSNNNLTTRFVDIRNAVFTGNKAGRGGAVGMMAAEQTYKNGGIATFKGCTFQSNSAEEMGLEGENDNHSGGAFYCNWKSRLTLSDCEFAGNTANNEGGALYGSGESTINMDKAIFQSNSTISPDEGNGGAVSLHAVKANIKASTFKLNESARSAGALYISYVTDLEKDSAVTVSDTIFEENTSNYHGGAVSVLSKFGNAGGLPLELTKSKFNANTATYNGGGLYTNDSTPYLEEVEFTGNVAHAEENSDGKRYGGGALYSTGSTVEINGGKFTNNSSEYNGGAVALYSSSTFIGNGLTAEGNHADYYGGMVYTNKSEMNLYHSLLKGNTTEKSGGALALYTGAVSNIYTTQFENNQAVTNGGAVYVYTGAEGASLIQDCAFKNNRADKYGGAIYISEASKGQALCSSFTENNAANGGAIYITTTDTELTLANMTVSKNTATKGPIIYGNTNKAKLKIDKRNYTDTENGNPDAAYWAAAIANKVTVEEIEFQIPEYPDYSHSADEPVNPPAKEPESVDHIFALENGGGEEPINDSYSKLQKLDSSSNFMSREQTVFQGINGKDVTVDSFVSYANQAAHNPLVGQGLLIFQAMKYKQKHPDRDVAIDISSFHFSVESAVCVDRGSRYFGYMRNLPGRQYDDNGFVRISHLLTCAAKMGIRVTVIGHIDAYPRSAQEQTFEQYFSSRLDEPCDENYAAGKLVGDFMDFCKIRWTSYGDNGASDMMHTKICAVNNYLDYDGKEHSGTIWLSDENMDGIIDNGANGNNSLHTAVIVSNHDRLYKTASNYLHLIASYGGQEDVYEFRNLASKRAGRQIRAINEGKQDEIDESQQIVYLGGPQDPVFELYFAPFGGGQGVWNETCNPFCKYLRKLNQSDDSISFAWTTPKYLDNFSLCSTMLEMVSRAFHLNRNADNRLYLVLPQMDGSMFGDLNPGQDIGSRSIGHWAFGALHNKDIFLSYSKDGSREYVSLLNSMNIHKGSMSYQSNHALVIKETEGGFGSVFYTMTDLTTSGIVEHTPGEWTVTKEATEKQEGLRKTRCVLCGREYTETIPRLPESADGGDQKPDPDNKDGGSDGSDPGKTQENTPGGEQVDPDTGKDTADQGDGSVSAPKSSVLLAKAVAKGKRSVKLTWTKKTGAARYVIYMAKCGKNKKLKKIRTVDAGKNAFTLKKLKKNTAYRYRIVAQKKVDGKYQVMAKSLTLHVLTGNQSRKYTNARKVTVKKKTITLKTGETKKIRAKIKKAKPGKKLMVHAAKYRYTTSNSGVAKVNKKGRITGMSAGTCTVYVHANNGVRAKIKVIVK